MTTQKKNRLYEIFAAIGFLSATISYSIGSNILETEYGAAARIGAIGVGFSLELLNGVAVTAVGILLFLRLRQYGKTIATGYLLSRIIEALLLSAGGLMVLTGANEALRMHAFFFQLAMIILGISSAIFYSFLMKWPVGPRWLFLLGVAGYLSLAFYAGMGMLSVSESAPVWLFVPGAVFEIVFPIWLIVKGFRTKEA